MATLLTALLATALTSTWVVETKNDPISDAAEVTASLKGAGGSLVLMCSTGDNRPVILFRSDAFLGGPIARHEWRKFQFRLDQRAAVNTQWKYLKNMVVAPDNKSLREFVQAISSARVLRVRALAYDNNSHDATFDLHGTAEAMAKARAACYPR